MSKFRIRLIVICAVIISVIIVTMNLHLRTTAESPQPPAVSKLNYKLAFSDNFNGTALDKQKWNTCYDSYNSQYDGCTNDGNNESEWYKPSQVSVSGGNLVLTAQKQTTQGATPKGNARTYDYTSGMVSSGRYVYKAPEKWSGSYGYYEARIKTPGGQAIWPAFWLLPVDHTWPPEIDVMELLGNKPSQVLTTYFWRDKAGKMQKDSSNYDAMTDLTTTWHIYAVNWQPGSIDWYVDGHLIKHVVSTNVPSKKMQIIFDLAVGGYLPGYPDATTPNTAKMMVDYIRVYSK